MENRKEFVNLINERHYKVAVEVGVGFGGFSEFLLSNCPEITLYSVDPWKGAEFRPGSKEAVHERLAKYNERSKIISKTSAEASTDIADNSVDFIYIDGDHSSDAVKIDIECWWPKLKAGGIFAGHDYHPKYGGLMKEVEDFSKKVGLKMNLMTNPEDPPDPLAVGEEAGSPSWWFEKPISKE